MPENSPALEIRIAQLERASEIRVTVCVLVATAAVAAYVHSQLQVVDPVRARRIELVDEEGRVRIELKHDSTETGVFIRDAAGYIRVSSPTAEGASHSTVRKRRGP